MKVRIIVTLFISFLLLFGETASASEGLDYREGDYLIHILEDGDGSMRTFQFKTGNRITASNTKIRLFINAREVDSTEYTVDYTNETITMRKAPDMGAEISMKYSIAPTFEWGEGVSGKASIGNALTEGDGSTRIFQVKSRYILNSSKNVSLYIDGIKLSSSEFKFNHEKLSVTILEKRQAPGKQSKIYFYFPKTSISGTQSSGEETDSKTPTEPDATPTPKPDAVDEPEFKLPSGKDFPGTITLNSNYTFTVSTTAEMRKSGYYTYVMIKNANGKLVKRIRIDAGSTSTYSLSKLGLPAGGYYFYLKTVNQYGGFAASNHQFIPVRYETQQIGVFIEGKQQTYTQPPVNRNGNVLVPLRGIFESLGATVKWESSTQTVTATKGGTTIVLTIGSSTAYVNGKPVVLNAAAQLLNGSTMVPIRFISEVLGGVVEWDKNSKSVIVFQNKPDIPTSAESERTPIQEQEKDQSVPEVSSPILQNISRGIDEASDIVFVIDVTGSMEEVIDYVKETISSFVESVPSGSNFAILAYRDINFVDINNPDLEFFGFTNQKNVLKEQLSKLVASGGMDLEESGLEAIQMAIQKMSDSKNAKRIVFITDAPVHEKGNSQGKSGYFLEEVIGNLKTNEVTLDAIAPKSGTAYKQIIQLVKSNKGTLYDIDEASLIHLE
ncbi:stalk domain-containing protein [Paenibacillus endoradicis]|uniref:stalk domain-containing protein n=1 Tax=Paenibacillus endoradicis TaxID=2972487 RepID=UPI0021593169|nr:stalk domain-containing protein [Paenibacillus endoradicis]MCR8659745.1 stalk domain-containing protein [Paenibacillus endoradicis]